MEIQSTIDRLTDRFQKAVKKNFAFLKEYGYKRPEFIQNFDSPQDMNFKMYFFSKDLCVQVSWYLIYSVIEVKILELKDGSRAGRYSVYGHKGYARSISVVDLAEYHTNGKITGPLPESLPGDSREQQIKIIKQSEEILIRNYDLVIYKFAELTSIYAADILKGDLSLFPLVQAYSRKKANINGKW